MKQKIQIPNSKEIVNSNIKSIGKATKKVRIGSIFIYPFLFPAILVLTLAGANLVILTNGEIAQYTFTICAIFFIIFIVIYSFTHDGHRTSFHVFLITISLAYFGQVVNLLKSYAGLSMGINQQLFFLVIWCSVFGFLDSRWVWNQVQKPSTITTYLNLTTIVLFIYLLIRIVSYQSGAVEFGKYQDAFPELTEVHANGELPDIYYIILDGYGRNDMLAELYQWNNSDFTNFLENHGFYIAYESQANYVQTSLSLSSSLNFDYLPDLPDNSLDGRPIIYFIQHNRLINVFKHLGYTIYTFETPYKPTNITQTGHYYSRSKNLRTDTLKGLLIMNSVVSIAVELNWIKPPFSSYGDQQNLVINNLTQIENLASEPGPKFIFLHLVIPHRPFIFDQYGPVTPDRPYFLNDTAPFQGTADQFITGYIGQITFLNKIMQNTIQHILEKSSSMPIVILQGDHGPGLYFSQKIDKTCLKEKFDILNAYLLPNLDKEVLYPSISPVNTFRLILDDYFGATLSLLPDKHYYSNFSQPYHFIDAGDKINEDCTQP